MGPAPRLRRCSDAWRYLESRGLPDSVLTAAAQCEVVREGPHGSAWFAHCDPAGLVIHVDVRGPTFLIPGAPKAKPDDAALAAVETRIGERAS